MRNRRIPVLSTIKTPPIFAKFEIANRICRRPNSHQGGPDHPDLDPMLCPQHFGCADSDCHRHRDHALWLCPISPEVGRCQPCQELR